VGGGKPDFPRIDYCFYVEWDAAPEGGVTFMPGSCGGGLARI
jgi:hypothetical protein